MKSCIGIEYILNVRSSILIIIFCDNYIKSTLFSLAGGSQREGALAIELRKSVRQIAVDKKKKKVLVRTRDLKQYEADAVVVALPLGVLKMDTVLFDPPLPKGWKKSIESLGNACN